MKKANKFLSLVCALSVATSAFAGPLEYVDTFLHTFAQGLGLWGAKEIAEQYIRPHPKTTLVVVGALVIGMALITYNNQKSDQKKKKEL